jgi:hypothetical protein
MEEATNSPHHTANVLYTSALAVLNALADDRARSFYADFPCADHLPEIPLTASVLPIVARLPAYGNTAPETVGLVAAILRFQAAQSWRQPYTDADLGTAFTCASAWFPIADTNGPLRLSTGLVEVMLLDATVRYPLHSHSAEELYIVLAGQVWWETMGDPTAPQLHNGRLLSNSSSSSFIGSL